MTVGIAFSNGLEAILLCDEVLSLESGDGTTEDTVAKLGIFCHGNYHGAMVGAGDGNMVIGGISAFSTRQGHCRTATAARNLDEFVKAAIGYVAKKLDAADNEWLAERMNNARKKAATIPDKPESNKLFEA